MRIWNLRIMVYTNDHDPAHIHVIGPDGEVRFNLKTWETLSVNGFSPRSVNRLRDFLEPLGPEFLEAWNEVHKKK